MDFLLEFYIEFYYTPNNFKLTDSKWIYFKIYDIIKQRSDNYEN